MSAVFLISKIILRSWNQGRLDVSMRAAEKFSVLHMARRKEAIETQKGMTNLESV